MLLTRSAPESEAARPAGAGLCRKSHPMFAHTRFWAMTVVARLVDSTSTPPAPFLRMALDTMQPCPSERTTMPAPRCPATVFLQTSGLAPASSQTPQAQREMSQAATKPPAPAPKEMPAPEWPEIRQPRTTGHEPAPRTAKPAGAPRAGAPPVPTSSQPSNSGLAPCTQTALPFASAQIRSLRRTHEAAAPTIWTPSFPIHRISGSASSAPTRIEVVVMLSRS
mmetsp:Transcript_112687/g.313467  ORF Transcript_112687/g.313467 Transcript_112687/m.313467 type:complete len:223 (+) Transcript_112687:3015-3683(+)